MSGETWKLRLIGTAAEAEAAEFDDVPVSAHELGDGRWAIEAYFEARPSHDVAKRFAALVPGAAAPRPVRLPPTNWVKYSQSALLPVTAGRFHVYTASHAGTLRAGKIGLHIEAGQAFGTGQHATTLGCLKAIDRAARRGARVRAALDLGTGTGVLALGIAKRWRRAYVVGSDIDPVAIAVARGNVRSNGERLGRARGMVELVAATGLRHARLMRRHDLVVANVLARPLVELALPLAGAVAPGGRLVLAGLLAHQARRVVAAYAARGLRVAVWPRRVGWPAIELVRPGKAARRGRLPCV